MWIMDDEEDGNSMGIFRNSRAISHSTKIEGGGEVLEMQDSPSD
jgi:hypothetical protein